MSIDEMYESTVQYAYALGYEQGQKDAIKHGHWIRHLAIGWSEAHYTCSCCGYYLHFDRRENANYCPNCGAKMDGDANVFD